MHAFSKLALLALGGLPVFPALIQKRASTQYTDTFDDLKTSIVAPQLFPVGLYHGIQYGGVVVLQPIEDTASVVPHSEPHQAGAAGPIDLLQLGDLTLNTYAQLVRGSTDTGTTEGLAQGGTVSVTGFDVNGNQVPTVSLSYAPKGAQNQRLDFAELPDSYKNLANVSIGVATSEPVTERTYIALDDVKHANHS